MVAEEAVRKLLRHHPLVNQNSSAGRGFASVGLGHLPFLDTEEQHPWGCFLEECVANLEHNGGDHGGGGADNWSKPPQFGATLELLAAAAGEEAVTEAVASIRHRIKSEVIVCFLASHAFQHPEAEALSAAFATALSASMAGPTTAILCDGSQTAFSKHCHDPSRLWHLAFHGEVNAARQGTTLHCCKNAEEKRTVTGKLCQAYVVLEGGPAVVEEVGVALENGAFVLPIPRCGGAAAGQHGFPEVALARPDWVHEEDWKLLSDCFAPLEETAAAAARIAAAYCSVLLPPAMEVASKAPAKQNSNSNNNNNDPQPRTTSSASKEEEYDEYQQQQQQQQPAAATPPRMKNRGNQPPLPRPRGSAQRGSKLSAKEDPLAALEAEEAQLLEEVLSLAKREEELLHKGSADEHQQMSVLEPSPVAVAPAAPVRVPPLSLPSGAKGAGRGPGHPPVSSGQRHGPSPPLVSGNMLPPRPRGL